MRTKTKEVLSVVIAGAILTTNCLFAHSFETNFWKNRQAKVAQDQYASLSLLPAPEMALPIKFANAGLTRTVQSQIHGAEKLSPTLISILNSSHGCVRHITTPINSNRRIILVMQDIHRNVEAQTQLSLTLQNLIKNHEIQYLGLEGAVDKLSLEPLYAYEKPWAVEKAADYLLKTNQLAGPIHAALVSRPNKLAISGVDDGDHHAANVRAYLESTERSAKVNNLIKIHGKKIMLQKKTVYNPALMAFDQKALAYHRGMLPLADYLNALQKETDFIEPLFESFIEAAQMEKTLNFSQVQKERAQIIEKLLEKNDAALNQSLTEMSLAFKKGHLQHRDFYSFLKTTLNNHNISLAKYKAMDSYIQYVLLSESLDPEKLLALVTQKECETYELLSSTEMEKRLIQQSKTLLLSEKLIDFSLTREEWNEYKYAPHEAYRPPEISSFEAFYEEAEIRDRKIAEHVIADMTTHQARIGALVCGGFHSEGIIKQLSRAGYTTVTYVPRTTKIDRDSGGAYLGIFAQEKTPVEQLFKGEKLFLATNPKTALGAMVSLVVTLGALVGVSPIKSLAQLAPTAGILNVSVPRTAPGEIELRFDQERKTTDIHVKVDDKFNVLEFTSKIVGNSNVLSALSTIGLWAYQKGTFADLSLMSVLGVFLMVRFAILASAFFEEFTQMQADGHFDNVSPQNWPQIFFRKVLIENFNIASILRGTELKQIRFQPKGETNESHVRKVGLMGPVANLSLVALGTMLSFTPANQSMGFVLVTINSVFFIVNLFFGSDGYAFLYGKVLNGAYNCGIFGFFSKKKKEERFVFNPQPYRERMNIAGAWTQRRGAQSAGIAKLVVIPLKTRKLWMFFQPLLAAQYLLLIGIGAIYVPTLSTMKTDGLTDEEARLARKGYFQNELGQIVQTAPEHRQAHIVVKRLNNRRAKLLGRLMNYYDVMMKGAALSGYVPLDEYESQIGHTRYATGSMTKLKNAHPHGSPPRLVKKWLKDEDGHIAYKIAVQSTKGVHNGDFNGNNSPDVKVAEEGDGTHYRIKPILKIFQAGPNGRHPRTGDIREWLRRMGEEISAEGDSPVFMAFINFMTAQGMWYQSAKIAYQFAVADKITDDIPAPAELKQIADRAETAYKSSLNSLYPAGNLEVNEINKPALEKLLLRIHRAIEENTTFTKSWTSDQKKNFAEIMLQAFLYNDLSKATKIVTSIVSEDSTLGLSLDSSHKPNLKVLTAHNKLPMAVIHDPTKETYFYGSDHNAVKSNVNFHESKIIYLLQQNREVATITPSGLSIYSNKLKRELTPEEIKARWVPLKDNSYMSHPDAVAVDNPLDYDIRRIPEETLRVHNAWDPTHSEYDKRNIAAADHLVNLIGKINDEKARDIEVHEKAGLPLNGKMSLTPDILCIGVENMEVALRQWVGTVKPRMLSSLHIRSIHANEFNKEWVDPDKRHLLLGQNTIVIVMSLSGLTFMSVDATEVTINIRQELNAVDQKLSEFAESLPPDVKPHFIRYIRALAEGVNVRLPEDDEKLLNLIKSQMNLIEQRKKVESRKEMLQVMAELEKIRRSRAVREVFTITNGWDNEMTRLHPKFDLNNPIPPNTIFVVGSERAYAEAASLTIATAHQFLTELTIYMADKLKKTGKSLYLGFKLSNADIDQMKANNRFTVEKAIPLIIGRFKRDDAKVESKVNQEIFTESRHTAQDFAEGLYVDLLWKSYVFVSVLFALTPFSGFMPLVSGFFNQFVPLYAQIAIFTIFLATPIAVTIFTRGTKWLRLFIYPFIFSIVLFMFTTGRAWGMDNFVSPTALWWLGHLADASFYVAGFYALIYAIRFKQGRQVFARVHGSRSLMFADDAGVSDYLYVTAGKVFSQAFGHFAPNIRKGDFTVRALMEESHNLSRGARILGGITDGRRPILNHFQSGQIMGLSQVLYTINALLRAGPHVIAVSNDPNTPRFNSNITLPDDASILTQDNRAPNADSLNMIVEERFLQLHRTITMLLFVNNVYQLMARHPLAFLLKLGGVHKALLWDPETQNFSMNLTTASPLNPIPSPQSFVIRDLIPIAKRLSALSDKGEIAEWIPSRESNDLGMNLAALLNANLYDERDDDSVSGLSVEAKNVQKIELMMPPRSQSPPNEEKEILPERNSNHSRRWLKRTMISLLVGCIVAGTVFWSRTESFRHLKSNTTVKIEQFRNSTANTLSRIKESIWSQSKDISVNDASGFTDAADMHASNSLAIPITATNEPLASLAIPNPDSVPSTATNAIEPVPRSPDMEKYIRVLSETVDQLKTDLAAIEQVERENLRKIAQLRATKRNLEIRLSAESYTQKKEDVRSDIHKTDEEIRAIERKMDTVKTRNEKFNELKDAEKKLRDLKTKRNTFDNSLTNALHAVRSNQISTDMTQFVLTTLSSEQMSYELNTLGDHLRPIIKDIQKAESRWYQALSLAFLRGSLTKLQQRTAAALTWKGVLKIIVNTDKAKIVIFNVGENSRRLRSDLAHAKSLLSAQATSSNKKQQTNIVFLIHGTQRQQTEITQMLHALAGISNPDVAIVEKKSTLLSNGLINPRRVLEAAAKRNSKGLMLVAGLLSGRCTPEAVQVLNLTKKPAQFANDETLANFVWILEEMGPMWNVFGPQEIERIFKTAQLAAIST